jgi:NTP pyrophosphatase (non-canonical NTP hydrolase)
MFSSKVLLEFPGGCSVPAAFLAAEARLWPYTQTEPLNEDKRFLLSRDLTANYNELMNTDELIEAVMKWGREHKIDNPVMQALKVNEEVGEIATEITHNRLHGDDMIDALGDSLVTIIVLADILGYDPRECLQEAYNVISKRKGETIDGCFVKEVDG